MSAVARELSIRPEMLRQWTRQATTRASHGITDIFPGSGTLTSQDEEIRRLRRELAQARDERDILGKAAFFARNSRCDSHSFWSTQRSAASRRCVAYARCRRPGNYAWVKRPPRARVAAAVQLAADIAVIHETSRGTYGIPRVHEELKAQGKPHSVNHVARIMRDRGIRAKTTRRFRITTDSTHPHPTAPNILDRQFAVEPAGRVQHESRRRLLRL